MSDDLARLLELPATARLSIAGDELALLTLRYEHADKIVVERERLGPSIDLADLLQLIGGHGLVETPQIQVREIVAPQLPAPVEPHADSLTCAACNRTFKNAHGLSTHVAMKHSSETSDEVAPAPIPISRRTTRNRVASTAGATCEPCGRSFKNTHALEVHQGRSHKPGAEAPAAVVDIPIAVSTAPGVDGICDVCRLSVKLHDRCSDCQALVGPEHAAGLIVARFMDQPLCATCASFRDVAREIGVAA
jgi:hypothetical protein